MPNSPKDQPVLIVDDSPAILALLRDMLRLRGYRDVSTAETSAEAERLMKERKPALVFLDIMLPDTSGVQLTRDALAANPHAHVVVTTALPPGHEAVVMAISQGAEDYLPKPLRPDALSAVLGHLDRAPSHDVGYG